MPPDAEIVPIEDAHLGGLQRCIESVARERRYLLTTEGFPLDRMRAFVAELLAAGGVQLVAVEDNRVVGWCDVRRHPWEGCQHVGVLGMGLLATHRGRGIGRRLLEAALEAAAARGITRVEIEVFASNTRALRLYERAGFVHEGRKRGARRLDGREDDFVMLARTSG